MKTMKLKLFFFAVAVGLGSPLAAQEPLNKLTIFRTGNDLLSLCEGDVRDIAGLADAATCTGYIQASVDAYMTFRAENDQPSCLVQGATGVQVRDMVTAYLRENPMLRHITAAALVTRAIAPLIVECP